MSRCWPWPRARATRPCAWPSKWVTGTSRWPSTATACSCPTIRRWSSFSAGSRSRGDASARSSSRSPRGTGMTDYMGGSGRPPSPPTLGTPRHSRGVPRQRDALAETDLTALIALLQFADGLFPSGGFAHSFGLETYAQERTVRDATGLRDFISTHLEGSAGPADAVATALAARAGAVADRDTCIALDQRLDAMKTVPEL